MLLVRKSMGHAHEGAGCLMIFTKKTSLTSSLSNIRSFLDKTRGQITIGEIPPPLCSPGGTGQKGTRRPRGPARRTIAQLLQRLDTALANAMTEVTVIDEVLPEIKRRRLEQA
jgi:hypothetical protein